MNSLSWLLYLADVAGNIKTFLIILALISLALSLFFCVYRLSSIEDFETKVRDQFRYCNHHDQKDVEAIAKKIKADIEKILPPFSPKYAILFTIIFVVLSSFASFIPSRDTVYAIAASEMGEKALQSPIGVKATKALETWLDRQASPAQNGK